MLYHILRAIAVFLFKLFFRIKVEGKEAIPVFEPFILASNHISNLDPIVLGAASPRKLYFLAKQELFANSLSSYFMRNICAIPLKRKSTDISAIKNALRLLKENKPLVIFPQGRRDSNLNDVLPGVGYLCKKTNTDIIVAKISGTDKVLPKGRKLIKINKIRVIFKKMEGLKATDDYQTISRKVLEKIKDI